MRGNRVNLDCQGRHVVLLLDQRRSVLGLVHDYCQERVLSDCSSWAWSLAVSPVARSSHMTWYSVDQCHLTIELARLLSRLTYTHSAVELLRIAK